MEDLLHFVMITPKGQARKYKASTWTSKMAKIIDPILPVLSILGYWAIILGSFGGPGTKKHNVDSLYRNPAYPVL